MALSAKQKDPTRESKILFRREFNYGDRDYFILRKIRPIYAIFARNQVYLSKDSKMIYNLYRQKK
jgi:hypothetical protein